jgi:GT2 family glycosyltransferase
MAPVTVVVVPRERFGMAVESLDSVLAAQPAGWPLVYVDAGSPPAARDAIAERAATHAIEVVREERFLPPNVARNRGLAAVTTPLVAFVDNDVLVRPGWIEALVECSEETGAAIVGPLTLQGPWEDDTIHCAGGEIRIREAGGGRSVQEVMHEAGRRLGRVSDRLERRSTGLAEFHGLLLRTSVLRSLGGFDEGLLNTREHLDLCLTVREAGGEIWFEPRSVITYVQPEALERGDRSFYMLRWSDAWERASLRHFQAKWDLAEDAAFRRRLKRIGWRRRRALLWPIGRHLAPGNRRNLAVEAVLRYPEKALNRWLTWRHARAA